MQRWNWGRPPGTEWRKCIWSPSFRHGDPAPLHRGQMLSRLRYESYPRRLMCQWARLFNRKKEKIPPSRFCSRSPSTQRTVPYQYRSRSSRRLDNTTRPWSCFTSIQLTKFNSLKISPLPFCSLCCNWYYIFIFDIFIFALSINNYSR